MRKLLPHICALVLIGAIFLPSIAMADNTWTSKLIVCDGTKESPCTFEKLVELAQNIITFMLWIATLVAFATFVYIGIKLVTSGGDVKRWSEAKKGATGVVVGFCIILLAWVIVYTISHALLKDGYSILVEPK